MPGVGVAAMRTSRSGSVPPMSDESALQPPTSRTRRRMRRTEGVAVLTRRRECAGRPAVQRGPEARDGPRLAAERRLPARMLARSAHHDDGDGFGRLDDRQHRAWVVGHAMTRDLLPLIFLAEA